jgi:hypothetical protein
MTGEPGVHVRPAGKSELSGSTMAPIQSSGASWSRA